MNWIKQMIHFYRSPDKDIRIQRLEGLLAAIFRVNSLKTLESFKLNAAMLLGRDYKKRHDARIIIRLVDKDDTVILSVTAKDMNEALAGVTFVPWYNEPEPIIVAITYTYRGDEIMRDKVYFTLTKGSIITSSIYNIV